jgi:hemolysin-activating ACP:hemolysin acyltransferase
MILGRSKQKSRDVEAVAPEPKTETSAQSPDASAEQTRLRPREARQRRFAQHFAQAVTVMMRDPNFRNLPLGDLEWLLLPPLMAGQFRFGNMATQQPGDNQQAAQMVPVALALWARVSAEIDKTLSEKPDKPARLPLGEWVSGDRIWLMYVAGDPRAMPGFMKQLAKNQFKGQDVKLRTRGPDGKMIVAMLDTDEKTVPAP